MAKRIQIETVHNRVLNALYQRPAALDALDQDRILVVMIHGFPGHMSTQNDLFGDLEALLEEEDFHTLRFDFHGCGKSDGAPEDFTLRSAGEDLAAVLNWATGLKYRNFIFISEGFGSLIAMLNKALNIKCQVMLWPALDPQFLAKHLYSPDTIEEEWKKLGYIFKDDKKIGLPFIRELQNVSLATPFKETVMPVLILQGSEDKVFPAKQLDLARKYMTADHIEITNFFGAEHGLPDLKHRKMLFHHILDFLKKFS